MENLLSRAHTHRNKPSDFASEWIRDNESIEHFDFNMDGKIDENDLNILSEKVEGER